MGYPEIIIVVAIAIGLFLALRSINLWYFKINESIDLQREQVEFLKKILEKEKEVKL